MDEDPGTGEFPQPAVLRLLLSEYALLRVIRMSAVDVAKATPSAMADARFLLRWDLVTQSESALAISPRGEQLLAAAPVSQTERSIGFDRRGLGW